MIKNIIITESQYNRLFEASDTNIKLFYHGGNEDEDIDNIMPYWITSNPSLALDYAFEKDYPMVYKVLVDVNKINAYNTNEFIDKKWNNATCLGLRDIDCIIKVEAMTEDEINNIPYQFNF